MKLVTTVTRAAGLGLCVVAFTGTALADPGKGNGNGPAVTPPGQEKKAEQAAPAAPTPAPAAAPAAAPENKGQEKKAERAAAKAAKPAPAPAAASKGQAKRAEKQAAKSERKAAKPVKPATTPGSYKATSSGNDLEKGMSHKHTICHATGSESNPYVRITPSISGVYNGHMGHQDGEDIVPPFTYKGTAYSQNWDAEGQAIFNAGCAVPSPPAPATTPTTTTTQSGDCPTTTTTTERVLVGIWHATGAVKDGQRKFVFISPSEKSAHFDKHEDDIPVYEERTVTATSDEDCEPVVVQTSAPPTSPPGEQPQPIVPTQAGETPAPGAIGVLPAVTPTPDGEVLGAVSPTQAPAAEEEAAGGVLGAVASAPEAIARTATSGTLPFTGLPLWIAALLGAGLLAVGLALRRSA